MPTARRPARSAALLRIAIILTVAAVFGGVAPSWSGPGQPVEFWYDEFNDGDKTGYRRVVWTPSTWEGHETIHDTTTVFNRTQRNMAGHRDHFTSTLTIDLERSPDGVLWWQRVRVEEAGRVTVEELRWTGKGYVHSSGIRGEEPKTVEIRLDAPVRVDAESYLGGRIQAGTLKTGERLKLRLLDLRARKARSDDIVVVGKETIEDENGEDLECTKLLQRDPESGVEALLWLDGRGLFVRMRAGGLLIRRTTQAKAEAMPAKAAEYRITVPGNPWLERIFNADRVRIEVHLRGDEHRKLPVFPTSPWSRVLATKGDEGQGWVFEAELRSHGFRDPAAEEPDAKARPRATLPVTDKRFERHLEATALMQVGHPLVRSTAAEVVGEEKDARKAAYALARHVFDHLAKESPQVGQADAVQILKDRKGDCSEHALVFVALCRAAGIPARLCSGYVCIGNTWGAHSWAEIWTGGWIGADPTTGEVGTAARYLFFGYPDEPGSYPSVISNRVSGRLYIVTTELQEGPAVFDLTDEDLHRIYDHENRRFLHVLAGLEAHDVPEDWRVHLMGERAMRIRGPDFSVHLLTQADQGNTIESLGRRVSGPRTTFAGAPALDVGTGTTKRFIVFTRRRIVQVFLSGGSDETLKRLEKVLAPTFADPVQPWVENKEKDE